MACIGLIPDEQGKSTSAVIPKMAYFFLLFGSRVTLDLLLVASALEFQHNIAFKGRSDFPLNFSSTLVS